MSENKSVKNAKRKKLIHRKVPYIPFSERKGPLEYPLTSDYLFKMIMPENENVLRRLLCALLNLKTEEIVSIEIKNTIMPGKTKNEKDIILDLKLILNHHKMINIEMQVVNEGNWKNRSLIYLCRNYDTVKSGDDYDNVQPAHHIGILDFAFPDEVPEFYSHYYLINIKTEKIYNDNFRLSVLHLNYIELATQEDIDSGLQYWADFFKAATWEELKMLANQNPVFEDAANTYYQLIQDPYVRADYEMLERDRAHEANREKLVATQATEIKVLKANNEALKTEAEALKAEAEALKAEAESLKAELEKYQKA